MSSPERKRAAVCWLAGALAAWLATLAPATAEPPQRLTVPTAARPVPDQPSAAAPRPRGDESEPRRPLAQAAHQTAREPVPLSQAGGAGASRAPGALRSIVGMLAALGAVLGLLLATLWGLRRLLPKDAAALPAEVFQVLGRRPLVGRQQAQIVRFGNKLVLLAVSPLGAEALAEITDPAEVERLAGLCQKPTAGPASTAFRQIVDQFAREPAPAGFVGSQASHLEIAKRALEGGRREARDA